MKKVFKNISISIFVIVVVVLVGYQFVLKSGSRDLQSETTFSALSSKEIIAQFATNADTASKKYTEKAVEITGTVTDVSKNQIIVDSSVVCECLQISTVKIGETIIIKGRFVGYDDLMNELKLDQCQSIKK